MNKETLVHISKISTKRESQLSRALQEHPDVFGVLQDSATRMAKSLTVKGKVTPDTVRTVFSGQWYALVASAAGASFSRAAVSKIEARNAKTFLDALLLRYAGGVKSSIFSVSDDGRLKLFKDADTARTLRSLHTKFGNRSALQPSAVLGQRPFDVEPGYIFWERMRAAARKISKSTDFQQAFTSRANLYAPHLPFTGKGLKWKTRDPNGEIILDAVLLESTKNRQVALDYDRAHKTVRFADPDAELARDIMDVHSEYNPAFKKMRKLAKELNVDVNQASLAVGNAMAKHLLDGEPLSLAIRSELISSAKYDVYGDGDDDDDIHRWFPGIRAHVGEIDLVPFEEQIGRLDAIPEDEQF